MLEQSTTVVQDFECGENISLEGAVRIAGYSDDGYQATVSITRDDSTIERDGNDLTITGPYYPGNHHGYYSDSSQLTIKDFYLKGISEIKIDGIAEAV